MSIMMSQIMMKILRDFKIILLEEIFYLDRIIQKLNWLFNENWKLEERIILLPSHYMQGDLSLLAIYWIL